MILIVSQSKYEQSTDDVIDWIAHYKGYFRRLNGEDAYSLNALYDICISNSSDLRENQNIQYLKECNVVWYRRWHAKEFLHYFHDTLRKSGHTLELFRTIQNDDVVLKSYLLNYVNKDAKWLTTPKTSHNNKLQTLLYAKQVGLSIPETLVTSSKTELLKFYRKKKAIITKDMSIPYTFSGFKMSTKKKYAVSSFTQKIDYEVIKELPDRFMPSLFQELIPKSYEIRTFYLDKKFYSMAIFSQSNPKTSLDFRHYDKEKPNRTVPYKLPVEVEKKLKKVLFKLNLKTASIDIIRRKNEGSYIFLEINPVGQFGMTSYPCNYYLEKKIALFLIKNDKS